MDHFEKQEAGHLPTTATYEDIANAIEDEHGAKYSPDGKRLLQGADIGTYEIKAGTEVICDEAFEDCIFLRQITIPSSVSAIEGNPFVGCTCTITCHSPHFKVVGNVLYNSDLTKLISCLSTQSHFAIPDSVTSIKFDAFRDCSSLRQINIPDSVTSIGGGAFLDCSSLRQINIPAGSRGKFERLLPDDKDKLVEAGD